MSDLYRVFLGSRQVVYRPLCAWVSALTIRGAGRREAGGHLITAREHFCVVQGQEMGIIRALPFVFWSVQPIRAKMDARGLLVGVLTLRWRLSDVLAKQDGDGGRLALMDSYSLRICMCNG